MEEVKTVKKERVIAYIDGFNLYSGIKEGGFRYLSWLNINKLCESIISNNQELVAVKYFTSLITYSSDKRQRQKIYLGALDTIPNVKVIYGDFLRSPIRCGNCGHEKFEYKEKMTDVRIACEMMCDAFSDSFDLALLISGDTDLVPPLRIICNDFKNKKVFVAFPPRRKNDQVAKIVNGSMEIGRKKLKDAQLEQSVASTDGQVFTRPAKWNPTPP